MSSAGALDVLLDLILPKRCVVCGAAGAWLCEACAVGLRSLPDRRCGRCGAPTRDGRSDDARLRAAQLRRGRDRAGRGVVVSVPAPRRSSCPECRDRELAFATAAAAFCYEGAGRALVTACKFRALRSLADEMARLAGPAFAAACDDVAGGLSGAVLTSGGLASSDPSGLIVTSVPAHRDHRRERGFDPAESFARRLARDAGLTYAPLLRRVRHGARQSGLGRAARAANVRQAFALREGGIGVVTRLKRVIIVDDVYTTGETLNQCAEALAPAVSDLHVFTFARTVRADAARASREQAVPKERCR